MRRQLPPLIDYRIDMWKTPWGLILNNVCHVSVDIMELIWKKVWRCKWLHFPVFFLAKRDEQNGAISSTHILFLEKMNICYLTKSLVIENIWSSSKVNYFIWMLFLFLWKCCLLNARLNAMLGHSILLHKCLCSFGWKAYFENLRWQCC